MKYPQLIQNLVNIFSSLPGLGSKSAERIVFYILNNPDLLKSFSQITSTTLKNITKCSECLNFTTIDKNPCPICTDPARDKSKLAIVEKPQDIPVVEKTKAFSGTYFILGGLINPAAGITPDKLNTDQLFSKIKSSNIKEVILIFDSNIEGESTVIYLAKLLKKYHIKISKPARGLPIGADIEYADEITLSQALKNRDDVG